MKKTRRKPSVQECTKKLDGECFLCPNNIYEGLEAHRIVSGEDGGVYHPWNCLTLCGYCHGLVTAGVIKIHKAYPAMHALRMIHWTDKDGHEHWSPWPKKKVGKQ